MENNTVQSEFEREVETYRKTIGNLHQTANDQQTSLDSLDDAMDDLQQSVAQMTDAVDEYDHARDELDAAVVSLGKHATESHSASTGDASATGVGPAAGD